ncbi:uncharacterized protein V1510DRAFT_413254 [Dipodascopsis tothii]|uniref:uncharacterized protein n=1 Tax=Dipodascopsis tothii TaxID=44089 RepID=UPI0034D0181C
MRIRKGFAAGFVGLALVAAYLGVAKITFVHDKVLHFGMFLALTLLFYWVVETSRKRATNATLIVCVLVGGVGSEFVQSLVPYRAFDPYDIAANVGGSVLALVVCNLYHKRMLERKRANKYAQLYGDVEGNEGVGLATLGPVGPEDV